MLIRSRPVSVEIDGVRYSGWYDVKGGLITVCTHQFGIKSGHLDDMPPEVVAATLLREMVSTSPET